jgi:rhamnose utilization protein RhaD (predicted bifunctional aldolase and dehydrogenase)
MIDRWDEAEAARCDSDLTACVYVSRLLGAEPALVLFGGGNTSVKSGVDAGVLYVKGSGADLAQVEERDFTALRLAQVQQLIDAGDLTNTQLAQAASACVIGNGPRPSIETLLHAVLPHRFVLHSHADSILAITNTDHGDRTAAEIFGALAPRVPFRESGFELAKAAHEAYRAHATSSTIGLILLHHGVFSFGDSARSAYGNMLRLVNLAEAFLSSRNAWKLPASSTPRIWTTEQVIELRCAISRAAGVPLVLQLQDTPEFRAFAENPSAANWWEEGPATPQHAVFVKRKPLFGRDVQAYAREYRSEVGRHRPGSSLKALGLDPAPRVVVDAQLGVWTAGINAHYAAMTAEILRHDIEIISRASGHDRYAGLPGSAVLDAEINYGGFEAKARARYSERDCLLGEVALLAGDADASSAGIAHVLTERGAEVAAPAAERISGATLQISPTDRSPESYIRELVRQVGGLDILILRPGWEAWLPACRRLLQQAPRGGRIVLVGPADWSARALREVVSIPGLRVSTVDCDVGVAPPHLEQDLAQACAANPDVLQRV